MEYQRYLDETYTYNRIGIEEEWAKAIQEPEIAFSVLKDKMTPNQDKVDTVLNYLKQNSIVTLIVGIRGAGKTALSFFIAEELHKEGKKIAIVQSTIENLPDYFIEVMTPQEAPTGSFIIYDEASITLNARRAMAKSNVDTSQFLAISRHQDKTICFISQHSGLTDVNILRFADMFLFKTPSFFEIYDKGLMGGKGSSMLMKYVSKMSPTRPEQTLFTDFSQWFLMETPLPSFWSQSISKTYGKLNDIEAVDFIVQQHNKGLSIKEIQKQLIPRGIEWDTLEVKNAIQSPKKMKDNIKEI
jgi:hypothetical protein